jgi:hypothetical protein
MSGETTERSYFGDEGGTDGRIICDTDLNSISNNMTRRAWEVPGYAKLLGFDQIETGGYGSIFNADTAPTCYARARGVFTIGGGLEPSVGGSLGSVVGAGMLGVWNDATPDPPSQNGVATMMWCYSDGSEGVTHDAATTAYKRWDLVYCTIAEADAATVTRHFKDAVTGAVTSEVVVPAKKMVVTYGITKGTEKNDNSEVVPAPEAGKHLLYAVHIDATAIDSFLDLTIPVGPLKKWVQPGAHGTYVSTDWSVSSVSGHIISLHTDAQNFVIFSCPGLSGNGEARLLGLRIAYKLPAGSYCKLRRQVNDSTDAATDVLDLSAELTLNGTDQTKFLDLRGLPANAAGSVVWGGGARVKEQVAANTGLVLTMAGPTNDQGGAVIYSVEWYWVGG